MTTPRTPAGKALLIAYGFLGCSGAILFFNLFLERIISFWAFILRYIHLAKLSRKGSVENVGNIRRDSCLSVDDSLDQWKPSVYKVQFLLFVTSCVIALIASALYHPMEQWSFFDALYFCFVSFSTIGFGDYVVSQNSHYPNVHWYRFANFLFIVLGCCCIYSFFNVTSLVLRTGLDLVIRKLDIDFSKCCARRARSLPLTDRLGGGGRPRRNAITADHFQQVAKDAVTTKKLSIDSNYDSDQSMSKCSDEMISMQDFLQTNKVALAMIQKQLWETSQRSRGLHNSSHEGFHGGVGPLAIVNQKLGQDDV